MLQTKINVFHIKFSLVHFIWNKNIAYVSVYFFYKTWKPNYFSISWTMFLNTSNLPILFPCIFSALHEYCWSCSIAKNLLVLLWVPLCQTLIFSRCATATGRTIWLFGETFGLVQTLFKNLISHSALCDKVGFPRTVLHFKLVS